MQSCQVIEFTVVGLDGIVVGRNLLFKFSCPVPINALLDRLTNEHTLLEHTDL